MFIVDRASPGLQGLQQIVVNLNQPSELPSRHRVAALRRGFSQPARESNMATTKSGGSKRGFAAMDPAKQREIASKGGKSSHGGGRKAASAR